MGERLRAVAQLLAVGGELDAVTRAELHIVCLTWVLAVLA
jgi:hypothetical protein